MARKSAGRSKTRKNSLPAGDDSPDRERLEALAAGEKGEQASEQSPTDTEALGDAGGAPEKPKRKYTKRSAPGPELPRETVVSLIKAPYAAAARFYGPHWVLTDFEADSMVDAHMALLYKYLPEKVLEQSPLLGALISHLLPILVRMGLDGKIAELKAATPARIVNGERDSVVSRETRWGEVHEGESGPKGVPPRPPA